MYPNPQEALPLTPRPNLEQYRKLAKDLVKACKSSDATDIRTWAIRWIDRLSTLQHRPKTLQTADDVNASARLVDDFARKQLSGSKCSLTTAQFVIARAHGFASWPKFASHLESLHNRASTVAAFETATVAIVSGDTDRLRRLLHGIRGWHVCVQRASTARRFFTTSRPTASRGIGSCRHKTAAR
jgi:hypothetical protein